MFSKEDYVSLEVAKLIKEKGFNEPCLATILKNGDLRWHDIEQSSGNLTSIGDDYYEFLCPTIYEAQKWLRDKHNIDIVVGPEIDEETDKRIGYCFDLYTDFPSVSYSSVFETYEEALNAGILESLKLLDYENIHRNTRLG
ncbi:hypothetical protein [Barnesiella intestinihominis]|uniref:hypothetical protein n=1 Tax=Barnesiella intestinihominis TaxID=487174 RepID=UPI0039704D1D